jgi:CheY-like chemotaxis protein
MGPDAEQALRELDERTKGALAATNTAVWELDLERREVTWSANLDALIKRPIDNLEEGLQSVHPADEPRVRAACMATIEDHRDYSVECRVLWPDGTVRWVVSEGRVVEAANGKPPRLIGSTTDVTDRHTLEDQLRQAQKVEAIGRFARGIAHDFNNLLTVIQGYSQLLADKASDPKQAAEIREVLQAADRARALTRELLAFSRQQTLESNAAGASAGLNVTGALAGPKASEVRAAAERKVLVIEDQATVRALVRRILEREGFGVLEADGSSDAERLFDEHRADIALVLADVGIPGEKGPSLFRRLASKKPELKVVYMSGHIEETALRDESQTRHERFLAKPFTAAGLITVVKDALRE